MVAVLLTLYGAVMLRQDHAHTRRRLRRTGWWVPGAAWVLVACLGAWRVSDTPRGMVPAVWLGLELVLLLVAGVLITLAWRNARNGPEPVIDPDTPDPWALAPAPEWVRGVSALLAILGAVCLPVAIRESWIDGLLLLQFPLASGYLAIYGRVPRFMLTRV